MKNRRAKLMLVILAAVLTVVFGAISVSAATKYKTKVNVNLRTQPSTSGTLIVTIPKGKTVTAGKTYGSWIYVKYKTSSRTYGGYVWKGNLKKKGSSSSSSSGSSTKKTLATAIWLRTGPGTNYSKIRAIPGGAKVTLLGESGNWYLVQYGSRRGYIHSGYFTDETTTRQVTTAIYMRTSPTKSASVITVVPGLARVTVRAKVSGKNWYKVTYNGRTGYIYGGYFVTDSGSSQSVRIVKTAVFIRSSMNVSSRANIIAWVPEGKEVTILSQPSSRWYYVKYGSKKGYMKAGYFR